MKRILERVMWYVLGAATVWQIYASLARCGSIDGGALLVPGLMLLYALSPNSEQRRQPVPVMRTSFRVQKHRLST